MKNHVSNDEKMITLSNFGLKTIIIIIITNKTIENIWTKWTRFIRHHVNTWCIYLVLSFREESWPKRCQFRVISNSSGESRDALSQVCL